jgi:acyl-[acyl-carrier-protein]-phospholipid O-acyltransferase / long-chain-fatty-acid--[acyl-carrier-protein] ligase
MNRLVEKSIRTFFKAYFRCVHRITVEGMDNLPGGPGKLIIVSNHASLLDGIILWTYLDLRLKIIVDRKRAGEFLLRPFMRNEYTVQIDSMNPYSLKSVVEEVDRGTPLLVFPEGRMTRTGSLMKIFEGTGFVAMKTGAAILPVHLKNTYNTFFSKKKKNRRFFAPIGLVVGRLREPLRLEGMLPRQRKYEAARSIERMLLETYLEAHNRPSTLPREFVRICRRNGGRVLLNDATGRKVSYRKALVGALVLGRHFSSTPESMFGLLLPNLTMTALIFMGLSLFRKVPVMFSYAGGSTALRHALELADPKTVITSRAFLERIKVEPALFGDRRVLYVEDLKDRIGLTDRVKGLTASIFTGHLMKMREGDHRETAAILFTSGSEGSPKGVCLSHENIITNVYQSLATVDVNEDDHFLNALPMFHSFGLTIGTILPMFAGAKVFLYVSPLHYHLIPQIIYDQACTIVMGTTTFLAGFSRKAHPYDFSSVRYIFCGAEPMSEKVFETYAKTFGLRVMTGYGVTECAPIISLNSPLQYEHGTVGRVLVGMEWRIVPVEGIGPGDGRAGRLYVKGKNVMKGYLNNEAANRKYLAEDGGWYDTGDVVEVTRRGFLRIIGRLKRFAKIGGEMVSLTALEEALQGKFGERKETAVIAVSDERRGEALVLVTTSGEADRAMVREILKAEGFSDLAVPRIVRYLKELPRLGTGKVDYVTLKEMIGNGRAEV